MWRSNGSGVPPTDANLNSISLEYSYEDVVRASRNFHQSHLLGRGSYGAVYKGILKDGTEVAIKVLNNPKDSGFKEEVLVLSKFRHPNLVILMGFSRNVRDRYLIYELLPGGDLCSRIQSDPGFDWRKRLTACSDAALGLSHLHNASPKVFHRDIKSQNILLDRNGTAKMADFGLALLAQPKQDLRVEQCSGTLGYADPLYISSSVVTEKSEVYSFGMVLLEVLTGRPPAVQGPNGQILYTYLNMHSNPAALLSMVQARAGWPMEVSQRIIRLALACTEKDESKRPIFVHVVARLRDLVNRFTGPPLVQQNMYPSPGVQLLQNQAHLEEALKKATAPAPGWNPFDVRSIWERPVPDEPSSSKPVPTGIPSTAEETPKDIHTEPPSVPPPVHPNRAVVEFDQELRSMTVRESDINSAMSLLFPSDANEIIDPSVKRIEKQKKEIAKHLLSAGFSLEQIKLALERTSSVEAAVEGILDQNTWEG
jgi:serine/threonine protein kinase